MGGAKQPSGRNCNLRAAPYSVIPKPAYIRCRSRSKDRFWSVYRDFGTCFAAIDSCVMTKNLGKHSQMTST
jgi:hypothetical protein